MRDLIPRLVAFHGAVLLTVASGGAEYARPELLASAKQLSDYAYTPVEGFSTVGLVVIDLREEASNRPPESDLPCFCKWRRVDAAEWKRAFADGEEAATWSKRIGDAVSNPDVTVVVADDGVTPNAARVWSLLRYWGVRDARVFNGSGDELMMAGLHMSIASVGRAAPPRVEFIAKPHPERFATRPEVAGLGAATCLIDTRTDREVAAGVIPGAAHADWVRFVDPETGKMRSADELAALLDEVGFDPEERAISYCRSGGRASVVAFAMELMGGKRVANYVGSWNDWTSDSEAPIAQLAESAP